MYGTGNTDVPLTANYSWKPPVFPWGECQLKVPDTSEYKLVLVAVHMAYSVDKSQ